MSIKRNNGNLNFDLNFNLKFIIIMLFIIISSLLSGCSDDDNNTWVVATSADNPPYEFIRDGEIEGFDIDLIIAIGQHLGKRIEFRTMEFHGILAALSTKNVDMAIAGMSVTKDRLARVDFSIPYTDAKISILSKKENNYQELENLKGKVIGAQLGTIWSLIAHDISLKYPFKTVTLASNLMLFEELKSGRVDALIMEETQSQKFISKNPQMSSFHISEYGSSFAIALPKGSVDKKNIDHTIKALRSNGTINSLAKKWNLIGAY